MLKLSTYLSLWYVTPRLSDPTRKEVSFTLYMVARLSSVQSHRERAPLASCPLSFWRATSIVRADRPRLRIVLPREVYLVNTRQWNAI